MHPYHWMLLAACAVSAFSAGTLLGRDGGSPVNRRSAALCAAACYWAICEILWNGAADADAALRLVKLSAPGWVFVGPMAAHVLVEATGESTARSRRLLRLAYAASALLLAFEWTTPWLHASVHRTSWGWGYSWGPLFAAFFALTLGSLGAGLWKAVRHFLRTASPGERRQGRYVAVAIGVPVAVASASDGLLPYFGWQPPRLGTLSLTVFAAAVAWSTHRYGFSLLAPGRFAPEILEALSDAVVLVRPGGEVRSANRAAAALAGRSAAALAGTSLRDLLPALELRAEGELEAHECELVRADARRVPVTVSTSMLRDKTGLPLGVILVVRDLREVADLRSRLVISGRLAAVGELAAGIAHEINNPISYVRSNLGLLGRHWRTLSQQLEKARCADEVSDVIAEGDTLLDESLSGIDRVAAIVRDVRAISHAGGAERRRVDLRPVLERVARVAGHGFDARIELAAGELPPVLGAPQELEQVFLNLVTNAGQATHAGGRVRIAAAAEGGELVVSVEDDGVGIAPEHLDRIFDPFFTTKPQGEGTGLGLAISYQIVRKHGGGIRVLSSPAGTTFVVRLPLADAGSTPVG